METVTVSGEDFRIIHNTLWEMQYRGLDCVVGAERIRAALKAAYEQDNSSFDAKMDYYREFQRENGLQSIWSIYELPVHGFLRDHPYPSDAFVVYHGHHAPVLGCTWGDVYRAADRCMRLSDDRHHIFIEHFQPVGNELRLTTGS